MLCLSIYLFSLVLAICMENFPVYNPVDLVQVLLCWQNTHDLKQSGNESIYSTLCSQEIHSHSLKEVRTRTGTEQEGGSRIWNSPWSNTFYSLAHHALLSRLSCSPQDQGPDMAQTAMVCPSPPSKSLIKKMSYWLVYRKSVSGIFITGVPLSKWL